MASFGGGRLEVGMELKVVLLEVNFYCFLCVDHDLVLEVGDLLDVKVLLGRGGAAVHHARMHHLVLSDHQRRVELGDLDGLARFQPFLLAMPA